MDILLSIFLRRSPKASGCAELLEGDRGEIAAPTKRVDQTVETQSHQRRFALLLVEEQRSRQARRIPGTDWIPVSD